MPKKKGEKPKKTTGTHRAMVVGLRGSDEWKGWLSRLAEFRRMTITTVIDQALVEYAERHGFEAPPKR